MTDYGAYGIEQPPPGHGEWRTQCPQCSPNRKQGHQNENDLAVNRDKETWYCHHCQWSGGLVGKKDGYGTSEKTTSRPKLLVSTPSIHDKAIKYLETRGISIDISEQENVTGVKRWCGTCGKEVEAIAFPYYRNDAHINTTFIHRVGEDKHVWQEKDAERILYGLDGLGDDGDIIVCEGQIDRLSFLASGLRSVLSVPDGAPDKPVPDGDNKFTYLASAKHIFDAAKVVILAGDNDVAGQVLNDELARRIGREKCKRIVWPDYLNDANDALVKIGPAMLAELVEEAQPYPVEGIVSSEDLETEVWDLYEHGYDPGLRIGLMDHDQHYRIRGGLISIVTGVTAHGKSLWLDHIMVRLAVYHDWKFGIFSPENQPLRRHYANLLEIKTAKPFDIGPSERMTSNDVLTGRQFMRDHFDFILPDSPSVDSILELARILVFQRGIQGLVMDPWNELEHARPQWQSETEYISQCLSRIRRFARAYDVHVWVLAHPTKWSGIGEERPTLNNIAGSVHFQNKADYGVVIWRNPKDTSIPGEVIVEKVRFRETGKPGVIYTKYDAVTRQMMEVNKQ